MNLVPSVHVDRKGWEINGGAAHQYFGVVLDGTMIPDNGTPPAEAVLAKTRTYASPEEARGAAINLTNQLKCSPKLRKEIFGAAFSNR